MDDWKKRLDDLFQKRAADEQKRAEERQKKAAAHAEQLSLVSQLFDSTINPAFEEVRTELLKHGSEANIVLAHPSAAAGSRMASAIEIDEGMTRFGYEIYASRCCPHHEIVEGTCCYNRRLCGYEPRANGHSWLMMT